MPHHDRYDPIWSLARTAVVMIAASLGLFATATSFDSGEVRALLWLFTACVTFEISVSVFRRSWRSEQGRLFGIVLAGVVVNSVFCLWLGFQVGWRHAHGEHPRAVLGHEIRAIIDDEFEKGDRKL